MGFFGKVVPNNRGNRSKNGQVISGRALSSSFADFEADRASRQPSDEMNAESDAGRAVQIPGAIGDVTERGRAEQLRQVLAAIVESSDDAIISKNLFLT